MVRSGRFDGFPFRLGAGPIRVLCCLPAMFLYTLFDDAVGNRQYAIHQRCEAAVFDGMFHTLSFYHLFRGG